MAHFYRFAPSFERFQSTPKTYGTIAVLSASYPATNGRRTNGTVPVHQTLIQVDGVLSPVSGPIAGESPCCSSTPGFTACRFAGPARSDINRSLTIRNAGRHKASAAIKTSRVDGLAGVFRRFVSPAVANSNHVHGTGGSGLAVDQSSRFSCPAQSSRLRSHAKLLLR